MSWHVPYFLRALARQPAAILGMAIVLAAVLLIPLAPLIEPFSPTRADAASVLLPPSAEHWFGTDSSGRDILSRVLHSPRIDLYIGLSATAAAMVIGIPLGVIAGYFTGRGRVGGALSELLMRSLDVLQAFPIFVLALALLAVTGPKTINIILVLVFLNAPTFLRLVRSEVLTAVHRSYVDAAKVAGSGNMRVLFRHLLPNAVGPAVVQASVTVGWAILLTSGLSFVGAGVAAPTPELGSMISVGAQNMVTGQWWTALFPGIALGVIVLGFALFGDSLREALDPIKRR